MIRQRFASHVAAITIVLAVFGQVVNFDYVNYDDSEYAQANDNVRSGITANGVAWAFTTGDVANWHPLTWLSLMADVEVFGDNARGHHLTNLLLHVAAVCLLFEALTIATGDGVGSWVVAVLWGVHPLHVESVAWISERKGILSTTLGLAAVLAYIHAQQHSNAERGMRRQFWNVATYLLFAMSLLAKQMWVTLPLLLLLLDGWPLGCGLVGNMWARIREKAPLFAITAIFSVVAFVAQKRGGAVGEIGRIPLTQRTANAVYSAATYLRRVVWPVDLEVIYPHPHERLSVSTIAVSAGVLLLLSAVAWRFRRRCPWLWTGWLWSGVALLPVLGIVPIGLHGMADRYTDVPMIGIWIAIVWTVSSIPANKGWLINFAFIAVFCVLGWQQTRCWRNGVTLFEHAIRVDPTNALAQFNFGEACRTAGDNARALVAFDRATALAPDMTGAWTNLGSMRMENREFESAIAAFRRAIEIYPSTSEFHFNLGTALMAAGKSNEARTTLALALTLDPNNSAVRQNLAVLISELGQRKDAIALLESGVALDRVENDYLELLATLCDESAKEADQRGDRSTANEFKLKAEKTRRRMRTGRSH